MLDHAKGVFRPSSAALKPSAVSAAVGGFSSATKAPRSTGSGVKGAAFVTTQNRLNERDQDDALLSLYICKDTARNLLKGHDDKLSDRISHCGRVPYVFDPHLERNPDTGKGRVSGVKSCGSCWTCPRCSPRISNKRRDELNQLLSGARAEKLAVVMVTLTASHKKTMNLPAWLSAFKDASKRLRQQKAWRVLKPVLAGSVSVMELTHGRNGYHPHQHWLLLFDCSPVDAHRHAETLRAAWLTSLAAFGLSGNDKAFDAQPADKAGEYIAKFGAADELALSGNKTGRNGSRGPWQLLSDARDGDKQAAAIWREYALAFRGKRQMVWSNGLKQRFGIGETSDEQAAAQADTASEPEVLRAWIGASERFRQAMRRPSALIRAAEKGSCLDAAEFGPSDLERWRKRGGDLVIEPPS